MTATTWDEREEKSVPEQIEDGLTELMDCVANLESFQSDCEWARERLKEAKGGHVKNKPKSRFVSSLAKEMRSSLSGIIDITELVLKTELSEEQLKYVKTVQRSTSSLLAALGDMIELIQMDLEATAELQK